MSSTQGDGPIAALCTIEIVIAMRIEVDPGRG